MSQPIPKVGTAVFVSKNGKFLMGQRLGSHGSNTWSIPGGHLEFGETPEAAGIREVMEETGLVIDRPQFAGITNDIFPQDNKHYITVWMTAPWVSGTETITEPDKCIEQRWADFDSMPQPLFQPCWENIFAADFFAVIQSRLAAS